MSIELISVLMFGLMLLLLASGLPIVFVLGGTAVLFGFFAWGPDSIHVIIANVSDLMRATVLVAVPLFVFMAYMLEGSGIAEKLYDALYRWMGPLRGGMAVGTVLSCTFVAAMRNHASRSPGFCLTTSANFSRALRKSFLSRASSPDLIVDLRRDAEGNLF